jgi:hypothetical protein
MKAKRKFDIRAAVLLASAFFFLCQPAPASPQAVFYQGRPSL